MPIAVNRNGSVFLEFSPIRESKLDSETYGLPPVTIIAIRQRQDFPLVYHRTRKE
jgi:hypothetical protein